MKRLLFAMLLFQFAFLATPHAGDITFLLGTRGRVVTAAQSYLGTSYRYGGADRGGVDCSGLVYAVYNPLIDEPLPRTVAGLYVFGARVDGPVAPGDLLFFDTVGGPSHVGIAVDENHFIHAASAGPHTGVILSSLDEAYYKQRFLHARSVLPAVDTAADQAFLIEVDETTVEAAVTGMVSAGSPVTLTAQTDRTDLRFALLTARRDGQVVLERRLRLRPGRISSPITFLPSAGSWELHLTRKDEKLALLRFEAGGTP